jgi:hypothetical protein
MQRSGLKVGLLDTDVFGPSLPTLFNLQQPNVYMRDKLLLPVKRNGLKLMSATSLRRSVGMSIQLHSWMQSQTVKAAVEMRHLDEYADQNDVEYAKSVRRVSAKRKDMAAGLGTAVHEAASEGIRPPALPAEDERRPYLVAYFKALEELGWKAVLSEAQVFNLSERYAGSLDGIAEEEATNDFILFDIKTGRGVYPDAAIQLALYLQAEFCGGYDALDEADVPDQEATEILRKVTRMGVLHLHDDESYEWLEVGITDELREAALHMVAFAHWVEKYPKMEGLII